MIMILMVLFVQMTQYMKDDKKLYYPGATPMDFNKKCNVNRGLCNFDLGKILKMGKTKTSSVSILRKLLRAASLLV